MYYKKGEYILAIENYLKCLEIQEIIQGKGNIDTTDTLNSIGLVYKE